MSRSGYTEDWENGSYDFYRQAVRNAFKGRRGRAFIQEMAAALDAMPVKELIRYELVTVDGACCAIGAVCQARGIAVSRVDENNPEEVGQAVGIAWSMAAETEHENDAAGRVDETPAQRWVRIRGWVDTVLRCQAIF